MSLLCRTLGHFAQKPFSRSSPIAASGLPCSDLLDLSLRCSKLVLLAAHLPMVKSDQRLGLLCHGKLAEALEGREQGSREFGIYQLSHFQHAHIKTWQGESEPPGQLPSPVTCSEKDRQGTVSSAERHVLS